MNITAIVAGIAAILAIGLAVMTNLYMGERDEFTAFKAKAEQAGKDAQEREDSLRLVHKSNLVELEKAHENDKLVTANTAVANYKLRHPNNPIPSAVCGTIPSEAVGNGAQQEFVSVDADTLRECAKDAGKVGWFQDYCLRSNCPIEE